MTMHVTVSGGNSINGPRYECEIEDEDKRRHKSRLPVSFGIREGHDLAAFIAKEIQAGFDKITEAARRRKR